MPTTLGQGWIIAEEEAMKAYLQGLTVVDQVSPSGAVV